MKSNRTRANVEIPKELLPDFRLFVVLHGGKMLSPGEETIFDSLKTLLNELLANAPDDSEIEDEKLIDLYAEAKNLQQAIENLG